MENKPFGIWSCYLYIFYPSVPARRGGGWGWGVRAWVGGLQGGGQFWMLGGGGLLVKMARRPPTMNMAELILRTNVDKWVQTEQEQYHFFIPAGGLDPGAEANAPEAAAVIVPRCPPS